MAVPDIPGYQMRAPCPRCGSTAGRIETRNGQDCIFCLDCGKFCYNAPRAETGREVRSIRTRPDLKPSQRARILARDNCRCIMCGRGPGDGISLVIGHLISVDEGRRYGLADAELFSDENLAAFCEECNSGQGSRSLSPRLISVALHFRNLDEEVF